MNGCDWGKLEPTTVSKWINFDSRDKDWTYDAANRESMASKQTEGVAYLWDILATEGTALLADEVGMGKTFQALGVAALLWKMKPHARVLVMAPNKDICYHWRREFETFVKVHYRDTDHSVKNSIDGGPVPSVQLCFNLPELVDAVERGAGHLYITTIHSLSNLVPGDQKDKGDLASMAGEAAGKYKDRIRTSLGGSGFDLVIVDEVHYLRNIWGGSQRVAAAKAFFGTDGGRLGQHNLLLTATPSHTQLVNVHSILNYFTDADSVDPDQKMSDADKARALLEKYALRRLRLMEGAQGLYSKGHYRYEKGLASSFEGRPNAELFFALYQKRLVHDLKKSNENRSLMYGYLEGFESVGRIEEDASDSTLQANNVVDDNVVEDFSKAKDSDLLRELTKGYYDTVRQFPEHPKYNSLIEQCVPSSLYEQERALVSNKHLVFVRRIPSVRELTQRFNTAYDNLLAGMILRAFGLDDADPIVASWREKDWSRDGFLQLTRSLGGATEQGEEDDVAGDDDDEENSYLGSRIAGLFTVKKNAGGQTDCANVRLRFVRSDRIFSLFLEPASDYLTKGYSSYYPAVGNSKVDYSKGALYERFTNWGSDADLMAALGNREAPSASYDKEMPTAWSLLVPHLPDTLRQELAEWATSEQEVAENFANYLKAGLLYASPVVVELYCWVVKYRREYPGRDDQSSYLRFLHWVEPKIPTSLLLRYFSAALESFKSMCGKIVDHGLRDWQREWKSLKRLTSPAWFASGENTDGRQRLIMGFNSPFYPNVLVATSVLQEGVNLHLNCHQIHHYGIAGSPGDNEQRVGRVDRLFGCVNRRLANGGDSHLDIYYPYLERSVDEDQVGSFVERKHRVEEQMDACLQSSFDKEVRMSRTEDWTAFLRKPYSLEESVSYEPYGANFDRFRGMPQYESHPTHTDDEIRGWLEELLVGVIDTDTERMEYVGRNSGGYLTLYLIDPVINRTEGRRYQPIFVNLAFYAEFSSLVPETAYILSLVTPIANKEGLEEFLSQDNGYIDTKLEELVERFNSDYPLVKLTINPTSANSFFYLSASVDLPLFVHAGHLEMLSRHELTMAFNDLKHFADDLESSLFNGEQDLRKSHIGGMEGNSYNTTKSDPFLNKNAVTNLELAYGEGAHGDVVSLSGVVEKRPEEIAKKLIYNDGKYENGYLNFLMLNYRYPMVRFDYLGGNNTQVSIVYPKDDLQEEEKRLFESWLGYVLSVCS